MIEEKNKHHNLHNLSPLFFYCQNYLITVQRLLHCFTAFEGG